jgi:sugar phosphate isomerase/epimerase
MTRIKLGISLKSLPWPLRRSLQEAQRLGAAGVELAAAGDLAPAQLAATGRRAVRHLLRSYDLEASAVFCPLRRGLDVPENQQPRIEFVKQVMSLAFDLGPRVVIVQSGRVPERDDDPRWPLYREAMEALGRHGDRVGATLALDTGQEPGTALRAFFDRFEVGSLAANYNPANLLINGQNPYEAARALTGRIAHVHAEDARAISPDRLARVPLGHGDIDWLQMLATFEEVEYHGFVTVTGADPAEIGMGCQFLRRLTGAPE